MFVGGEGGLALVHGRHNTQDSCEVFGRPKRCSNQKEKKNYGLHGVQTVRRSDVTIEHEEFDAEFMEALSAPEGRSGRSCVDIAVDLIRPILSMEWAEDTPRCPPLFCILTLQGHLYAASVAPYPWLDPLSFGHLPH